MEWEASEGMDLTALSDADFLTKVVIIASFIGIAPSSSGLILSRSDSPMVVWRLRIPVLRLPLLRLL
jgi:hypothetical protein